MSTTIGVSEFCKGRHGYGTQGATTKYHDVIHVGMESNWEGLIKRVLDAWDKRTPGYTDGVILVAVDPYDDRDYPLFTDPVTTLQDGDTFTGVYTSRYKGETPRKKLTIDSQGRDLTYAKFVRVVLYSREKLAEKDEDRTGCDWDIITILGSQTDEETPMPPETLMANHFGDSGGSNTNMSPEAFQEALRKSYWYWRDKVCG